MEHIYALRNTITGRVYVGRTHNVDFRIQQHMSRLKSGTHQNKLMQMDYDLYGNCSFRYETLYSAENLTRTRKEGEYMLRFKTYDKRYGYNYMDPFFRDRRGMPTKNLTMVMEKGGLS